MKLTGFLLLVLFVVLSLLSVSFADEDAPGIAAEPLDTTPQSVAGLFRLQYRPVPGVRLGAENASLGLNVTHSNFWVNGGFPPVGAQGVVLDAEITEWLCRFDYGVIEGWDIGVHFRVMAIQGGFLDEYIEWFHGVFNFKNANREFFPRNNVVFFDSRYGYAGFESGTFLNDVIIENRFSAGKVLTVIHQLRIPVDSVMRGFGTLLAGQVDGRWRDCGFTFAMGVSWHEDSDFFFYRTNSVVGFTYVGIAGKLESDFSLALGFHLTSSVFAGSTVAGDVLWYFDNAVAEIHFGARWMPASNCIVQLAVTENFTVATAADIGFNLSITLFGPPQK